jgi:hypothetical protein
MQYLKFRLVLRFLEEVFGYLVMYLDVVQGFLMQVNEPGEQLKL